MVDDLVERGLGGEFLPAGLGDQGLDPDRARAVSVQASLVLIRAAVS